MKLTVILLFVLISVLFSNVKADEIKTITLNSKNTLQVAGYIDENQTNEIFEQFLKINIELPDDEPIYIVLNSKGGYIEPGIILVMMLIQNSIHPIHTITIHAGSTAFYMSQLFQSRYIIPNGKYFIHRPLVALEYLSLKDDPVSILKKRVEKLEKLEKLICERIKIKFEDYVEWVKPEIYVFSKEAIEKKISDEIVNVECDKTLKNKFQIRNLQVNIEGKRKNVVFSACPLNNKTEKFYE